MTKFGNNWLDRYGATYNMNLYDGGLWDFDRQEINAFEMVLSGFEQDSWLIEGIMPRSRTHGNVLVRKVFNLICLEEGGRLGRFPTNKISDLRDAIRTETTRP